MNEITEKEFNDIRDYIKKNFGINLGPDKKSLIYSRLRSTLMEKGFTNFSQYYEYLLGDNDNAAMTNFINRITTNHTFFMREPTHFQYLKEVALPEIEQLFGHEKDLRLWCAGCSSGEEAYTLKMIAEEHFKGRGWNTEILATDISSDMLRRAVAGRYSADVMDTMPREWLGAYFSRQGNEYVAKDSIKNGITYRYLNLMNDFKFRKKFQIIFCRNVMIYFDIDTRLGLVDRFYEASEEGAYLFIGHSESLNNTKTKYKYIIPAVYRK